MPSSLPRLNLVRACALAGLLLLAQALGLVHAVVHAPGLPAPIEDPQHAHHGGEHQASGDQCRLVDAHAAGDLAGAASLAALPEPVANSARAAPTQSAAPKPRVWAPPARGPPALPR